MNLPNKLTVARMVMAFVFVALLSFDHVVCLALGYALFIAASITDIIDGRIARSRNLVTNFGKLLDPVADKILVAAGFTMARLLPDLMLPGWVVVSIIGREFLVTGARSLAASEGIVIAANRWGKLKAVFQMGYIYVFLGLVLVNRIIEVAAPDWLAYTQLAVRQASLWAGIFVAGITIYSGYQFAVINWRALRVSGAL